MATKSKRSGSGPVLRSLSPSDRCYNSPTTSYMSSSSPFSFASSTSNFSSPPSTFFPQKQSHHRSASPTRVNLYSSAPLFRFSIDRAISPNRSAMTVTKKKNPIAKKTCMCSPTTHPGSFRCSLHKNAPHHHSHSSSSYTPHRLNMRRSAMKNSLVRIGGVEGEWVKRALTALIRPSSHQQRRRGDFQPQPSRLSIMMKAGDDALSV